jgi:hypothetical protein
VTLITLGVGAQASPRFAPAGLLILHAGARVVIDGGDGAIPAGRVDAWLVTDQQSELIARIRKAARARGVAASLGRFQRRGLSIRSQPVVHTNHPACGYEIEAAGVRVVWAPEFYAFPRWARGADLMFAEAAAWNRPIRFVGGVGGHLDVQAIARAAARYDIKRLVFAHIGRPTLAAIERGFTPPLGEFARDGQIFRPGRRRRR